MTVQILIRERCPFHRRNMSQLVKKAKLPGGQSDLLEVINIIHNKHYQLAPWKKLEYYQDRSSGMMSSRVVVERLAEDRQATDKRGGLEPSLEDAHIHTRVRPRN